uniref:Protein kinase domain-containing protein n=1 Tax=Oryza nivara TaxID=4536 RepID=A0A0E0I697_ORYNI
MAPVTEDEAAAAAERIFERLAESGGLLQQHDHQLQRQLRLHFRRMPARYLVDMCGGKAEEVLIHLQLLADCADPANRPVVHARFLLTIPSSSSSSILSALVSEVGLNIREAHVYSTLDAFSLSVFLVDGWNKEEAGGLLKAIKEKVGRAAHCIIFVELGLDRQIEILYFKPSGRRRLLQTPIGGRRPEPAPPPRTAAINTRPPRARARRGAEGEMEMEAEDWGESSSPPRPHPEADMVNKEKDPEEMKRKLKERILELEKEEVPLPDDASAFVHHLSRLPKRYLFDLGVDRVDDVLLHWRILTHCAHPQNRPVFHARFQKSIPLPDSDFDPCQRLMEDLSLERRRRNDTGDNTGSMSISSRYPKTKLIHEIIFSSLDKPKLLSRLTLLLSEVGLNIREAHVYSTTDGFCLDVFVVDGWDTEETDDLIIKIKEALYRGTYNGLDVAVKILRDSHFNNPSVNHENVLQFYGACTRPQKYCIVTEYMPGGNLYDFLHKQNNVLDLLTILRIAISISKGMNYLHQNNIIHRDLKTANLLMGYHQVVKIADFGVARQGNQEGQMTAETGTYRWMAPEIINHKPYDNKADVFSFAIVLWELVPYDNMTPLQAALGVRQGFRLEIPSSVNPRLSKLIQRCWDEDPDVRPRLSSNLKTSYSMPRQTAGEPVGVLELRYRRNHLDRVSYQRDERIWGLGFVVREERRSSDAVELGKNTDKVESGKGNMASARRDQVNGNGDGQSYANHRLLRQAALTKIKSTASEEAPIKLDRHPLTTDELNHARSGDCSSKEPVGVDSPRRGRETTAPEYGDAAMLRKTRTREESEND